MKIDIDRETALKAITGLSFRLAHIEAQEDGVVDWSTTQAQYEAALADLTAAVEAADEAAESERRILEGAGLKVADPASAGSASSLLPIEERRPEQAEPTRWHVAFASDDNDWEAASHHEVLNRGLPAGDYEGDNYVLGRVFGDAYVTARSEAEAIRIVKDATDYSLDIALVEKA